MQKSCFNSRISQYVAPPTSSPERPDFQLLGQYDNISVMFLSAGYILSLKDEIQKPP